MTTMSENEVKCCVCGNKSSHRSIRSTNALGSSDLDTRPPEMMRSLIHYLIQRCPVCGYCSYDLSQCNLNTEEIVKSQEYQEFLNNRAIPEVAASFLALSYEKQQAQQYSTAAWSAIHAAWICDDANQYEPSKQCREMAIALIEQGEEKSQTIADPVGESEAITIDLMRRAGMFQKAMELVEETKTINVDEIINQIICFEETLINSQDIGRHTVSEVLGDQ